MSDDSLRVAVAVNDTVEVQVGTVWVEAKVKKMSNTDVQVDFTAPSGGKKVQWMARKDKRWRPKTGGPSSSTSSPPTPVPEPSYPTPTPSYSQPIELTPTPYTASESTYTYTPSSSYNPPTPSYEAPSKAQKNKKSSASSNNEADIVRMPPGHFCHILDSNTLITKLMLGPITQTLKDQEEVVYGPEAFIVVPPRSYCVIQNPVVRDNKRNPIKDASGVYKVKYGEQEIRFRSEPFPLYPGESLSGIQRLEVIQPLQALHLRAVRDFMDGKIQRQTGDEWLFIGPGTYYPRVEVQTVKTVNATIIKPNQALKLRTVKNCNDAKNIPRISGEEWIVKEVGPYLPSVYEEIVAEVKAYSLTENAIHLTATKTFIDAYKKERKAGEEWLLTSATSDLHIPDVFEKVIAEVKITVLTSRQYCVVLDPYDPVKQRIQLGKREVRTGVRSFYLHPGESLEKGIQNIYVLKDDEALLLCARELYKDGTNIRKPGDRWMIHGPLEYVPPIDVDVIEKRHTIALGDNEGIYVRNMNTGEVVSIIGQCYMLKPHEELWEKYLAEDIESLLDVDPLAERTVSAVDIKQTPSVKRDKTRVVSYKVPSNSAIQIFDYKKKSNRVSFGPDLVLLGPNEVFTVLRLSGGRPKQEGQKQSLALLLGPDFMTDEFVVETSDHARLSLVMAYNWQFDINVNSYTPQQAEKIFSINDFVGMACRSMASKIRGAIARASFDNFHKHSASIIHNAVFAKDEEDHSVLVEKLKFSNLLCVTGIDIQSVEPTDNKTREALLQSVQMAIEITTKSQEMGAKHEADRKEQAAKGLLDRQRLSDMAAAEDSRKTLLILKADSIEIEAKGRAAAQAKATQEAKEIEARAQVEQTLCKTKAQTIEAQSELEVNKLEWAADIEYKTRMYELEIKKKRMLNAIEAQKFHDVVSSIGSKNITEMANSGPDTQAMLLQALGIKSVLLTDGTSPINVFDTTEGFVPSLPATGKPAI